MALPTPKQTPSPAQLLIAHLIARPELAANLKIALGHLHPTGEWHTSLLELADLIEQCDAADLRDLL